MDLLDIPQDVLLRILYKLEVQDILGVGSTCRSLRQYILHDAKHLWLVKLHDLDVSCDPGIPPNVSVESLPTEELRRIVIKTVRLYTRMTETNSPAVSYVLRKTVVPIPPESIPGGVSRRISRVKLIPGGRYLFVCWAIASPDPFRPYYFRDEELCIIDTNISNQRVWSYDPAKYHGDVKKLSICGYDFDVRKDGRIILALMTESEVDKSSNPTGLFQVYNLTLDPVTSKFEESLVYSSDLRVHRHRCCTGGTDCQVSGDYVALVSYADRIITLVKWDEGRSNEISFGLTDYQGSYRLWRNHLFYIDFKLQELRAVSVTEVMSSASPRAAQGAISKLEELNATTLQLDKNPENEEPLIAGFPMNVSYSICDAPWKDSRELTFTILSQARTGFAHYTAMRVKFHPLGPEDSSDWTWTFLSARTSKFRDYKSRTSYTAQGAVRSGRFLVSSQKQIELASLIQIPRDYSSLPRRLEMVIVDREGLPIIPQMSENMANLLARAKEESGYIKQFGEDYRLEAVVEQLEEYSGAIVVSRNVWSGRDFIEIYYPE